MSRFQFVALILITSFVSLTACAPQGPTQDSPDVPEPQITADNFPLLDSSTSAEPILATLTCHFMDVPCEWVSWLSGDRRLVPDLGGYAGDFPGFQVSGTHGAYLNLIDGGADLIFVARAPSEDELVYATNAGVSLEVKPVALDAFVFIVNQDNPVAELTTAQIRAIYTGGLTNWADVGGLDAEIHPYQRNETSGSQVLMRELVMGDLTMIAVPDMTLPTMVAPFNAVSTDPDGIGYSVYFYERNMAPEEERVKMIAVDGVYPDGERIGGREYPYATEVYVVIRRELSPNNSAYQLRDWILTSGGQVLIQESGYVPLSRSIGQ